LYQWKFNRGGDCLHPLSFSSDEKSAQETDELVACQPSLTNDRSQRPDRNVFPLRDDNQPGWTPSERHSLVASLATPWCVFESGLSERRDDL
jgi:hypothetical protein